MKKGDIFKLDEKYRSKYRKNFYKHPFVYWEAEDSDCRAIMLTTSNKPEFNNIELKKEYFKSGYEIEFGKSTENPKSYIAPLYLLKDIKLEHLEFKGELSNEGIEFISSIFSKLKYTDWGTYSKKTKH